MCVQKKAMYYRTILTLTETRFGSQKLLAPANPYEVSLNRADKVIAKVDLLECLKDVWGETILLNRDNIYKIVSGDTTDEQYVELLCAYYKTHAAFANYVDLITFFGRRDVEFINSFVQRTRQLLNDYADKVEEVMAHSKFLLETNEYRYYAIYKELDISELEGVTII